MAYVVVKPPGSEVFRVQLNAVTLFGRTAQCDVALDDQKVSRRHCRIYSFEGEWFLEDMSSHNGTRVSAGQVRKHALRDGEEFEIGKTKIIFHAHGTFRHRPANPEEAKLTWQVEAELESNTQLTQDIQANATSLAPSPIMPTPIIKSEAANQSTVTGEEIDPQDWVLPEKRITARPAPIGSVRRRPKWWKFVPTSLRDSWDRLLFAIWLRLRRQSPR